MLKRLVLALALACGAPAAHAASYSYSYSYEFHASTGDAYFDTCLADINAWAATDVYAFVDEVVLVTGAPRVYVEEYVVDRRYAPADVWMIAETSRLTGQSFSSVASTFSANRTEGWGAMAHRLGIKPGSSEFHALKARTGKQRDSWKAKGKSKHAARSSGRSTTVTSAAASKAKGPKKAKAAQGGQGKGQGKAKGKGKGGKD